jgi:hypothetical protein
MRAPHRSLGQLALASACAMTLASVSLATVAALGGCKSKKHEEAKWLAPPKSFDPKGAELTFNAKNLEAFNTLSVDERAAHIDTLKNGAGTFKGQATFRRQEELADTMDDRVYGRYDVWATVPDPVFLEITLEYHLFSESQLISGVATGTHIEFTGTLAELVFLDEAKPRKMEIKVKADAINVLQD